MESVSVIINYNASVNSSPKFFKINTKYDYTLMFYQKETPFEQLVCKTGLNMYFKSAVKKTMVNIEYGASNNYYSDINSLK